MSASANGTASIDKQPIAQRAIIDVASITMRRRNALRSPGILIPSLQHVSDPANRADDDGSIHRKELGAQQRDLRLDSGLGLLAPSPPQATASILSLRTGTPALRMSASNTKPSLGVSAQVERPHDSSLPAGT